MKHSVPLEDTPPYALYTEFTQHLDELGPNHPNVLPYANTKFFHRIYTYSRGFIDYIPSLRKFDAFLFILNHSLVALQSEYHTTFIDSPVGAQSSTHHKEHLRTHALSMAHLALKNPLVAPELFTWIQTQRADFIESFETSGKWSTDAMLRYGIFKLHFLELSGVDMSTLTPINCPWAEAFFSHFVHSGDSKIFDFYDLLPPSLQEQFLPHEKAHNPIESALPLDDAKKFPFSLWPVLKLSPFPEQAAFIERLYLTQLISASNSDTDNSEQGSESASRERTRL